MRNVIPLFWLVFKVSLKPRTCTLPSHHGHPRVWIWLWFVNFNPYWSGDQLGFCRRGSSEGIAWSLKVCDLAGGLSSGKEPDSQEHLPNNCRRSAQERLATLLLVQSPESHTTFGKGSRCSTA